eukprot:6060398-Pleurochrysis_carterae.AAC.1
MAEPTFNRPAPPLGSEDADSKGRASREQAPDLTAACVARAQHSPAECDACTAARLHCHGGGASTEQYDAYVRHARSTHSSPTLVFLGFTSLTFEITGAMQRLPASEFGAWRNGSYNGSHAPRAHNALTVLASARRDFPRARVVIFTDDVHFVRTRHILQQARARDHERRHHGRQSGKGEMLAKMWHGLHIVFTQAWRGLWHTVSQSLKRRWWEELLPLEVTLAEAETRMRIRGSHPLTLTCSNDAAQAGGLKHALLPAIDGLRDLELSTYSSADVVIAISDDDRAALLEASRARANSSAGVMPDVAVVPFSAEALPDALVTPARDRCVGCMLYVGTCHPVAKAGVL